MKMDVFITVKTYPALSMKYDEIVCTAGINRQGQWVRIFPISYRKLEFYERYKKYQWIEFDLIKNEKDFRPESYRPLSLQIIPKEVIDSEKGTWTRRKEIVLKDVQNDLEALIIKSKVRNNPLSLATFKPTEIIDFVSEPVDREWDRDKLQKLRQMDFFTNENDVFKVVNKIPYKFSFIFKDIKGKKSKMMIEDWETGQLFWNCLKAANGDEEIARQKVKQKYFDDFAQTKDLYFFLGTTQAYHYQAKNPFIIIGTFHPKKEEQTLSQLTLF
jgi:hypothetical protein